MFRSIWRGGGRTDKSVKVRVERVAYRLDEREVEERTHTLTIPRSLLRDHDGKHFAPRWLLRKTIRQRILQAKGWPDGIGGGVYLERQTLWEEVFAPVERLLEEQAALACARAEADRPRREAKEKMAAERAKRASDNAEKEAEKRRVTAERAAANKLKLPTVRVSRVEWDGWERRGNKYGGSDRVKVTYEAGECTLRFSGQRVYLQFDDGEELIKARKNVRWEVKEPGVSSEPSTTE